MLRLPPFDKIGASPTPDFTNADPTNGVAGSIVNGQVFNQLQHEAENLMLLAGVTPDGSNLFQWTQAVSRGGIWVDELTGTGDLAVATLDAVLPALLRGMRIGAVATATNTVTNPKLRVMNLGSTGAYVDYPILKDDGSVPPVGFIKAGRRYRYEADGAGGVTLLSGLTLSDVATSGQFPVILQSPTLYVRTDGNDANDGSANTSAKAFATIGAAAAYGKARYYLAGVALTIRLGIAGTYAFPGNVDCGGGSINIIGDVTSQGSYIVQGSGPSGGASALIASVNGSLNISGLTITNTGTINSCVAAAGAGSLSIANVTLGTTVNGSPSLVAAYAGGNVTIGGGCVFAGSAGAAMFASSAYITMAGNIGLANNPNYTTGFCVATGGGVWSLSGSFGFTSATATGPRYFVTTNGIINTNGSGAGFFPGSAAGSTATGGQYV